MVVTTACCHSLQVPCGPYILVTWEYCSHVPADTNPNRGNQVMSFLPLVERRHLTALADLRCLDSWATEPRSDTNSIPTIKTKNEISKAQPNPRTKSTWLQRTFRHLCHRKSDHSRRALVDSVDYDSSLQLHRHRFSANRHNTRDILCRINAEVEDTSIPRYFAVFNVFMFHPNH